MDGKCLEKRCRVCGDVALGFNFNGLSCESCKAFFRRNAIKNKGFKCRKSGSCHIDKKTRKFCKSCRLNKCLAIGMRRELIWVNRDESRNHKNDQQKPSTSKEQSEQSASPKSDEDISDIQLENTIHLQAYELERIQEISEAMAVFRDEKNGFKVNGSANAIHANTKSLNQVVNLAENYVNKIILFCRKFAAFTCLKLPDQITLLKCFYPEIAAVCASFLYNVKRDGLPVLMNEVCDKAVYVRLENYTGEMSKKERMPVFRNFVNSMNEEMENDVQIRNLILVQLLFKPRDTLSCPEFMRYNYRVYCHLLRRYLQHKYQDCEKAEDKFTALMRLLNRIGEITSIFREVYLNEVDLSKVAQVLTEIYNLI